MAKTISIIVAVADNNGIGKGNDLLTHISNDLKRFKKITSGHPVVMGRNTWDSLPFKPLPKRKNVVLTSREGSVFEGALTVHSIEEALAACPENEESFIMGGAQVYKQFLPIADKLYLTRIYKDLEADTFFPEIDLNEWEVIEEERVEDDAQAGLTYAFINMQRK